MMELMMLMLEGMLVGVALVLVLILVIFVVAIAGSVRPLLVVLVVRDSANCGN